MKIGNIHEVSVSVNGYGHLSTVTYQQCHDDIPDQNQCYYVWEFYQ